YGRAGWSARASGLPDLRDLRLRRRHDLLARMHHCALRPGADRARTILRDLAATSLDGAAGRRVYLLSRPSRPGERKCRASGTLGTVAGLPVPRRSMAVHLPERRSAVEGA